MLKNDIDNEKLAEIVGVSRTAISNYRSGRLYPPTDRVIKMSEIFGVTTDYLLKGDENEEG